MSQASLEIPKEGDRIRVKDAKADLRILKQAAQSAILFAKMVYGNRTRRAWTAILSLGAGAWFDFMTDVMQTCRSMPENMKWTNTMAAGGFFVTMNATFKKLSDKEMLDQCHIDAKCRKGRQIDPDTLRGKIVEENELASFLGRYLLRLNFQGLKRHMWLVRGWPTGAVNMVKSANSEAKVEETRVRLNNDVLHWNHFNSLKSRGAKLIAKRSVMCLVPVQQIVEVLRESADRVTDNASDLFEKKFHRFVTTEALEDGFQRQELAASAAGGNHTLAAQTLMQKLVEKKVLSEVHEYHEPDLADSVTRRLE